MQKIVPQEAIPPEDEMRISKELLSTFKDVYPEEALYLPTLLWTT